MYPCSSEFCTVIHLRIRKKMESICALLHTSSQIAEAAGAQHVMQHQPRGKLQTGHTLDNRVLSLIFLII